MLSSGGTLQTHHTFDVIYIAIGYLLSYPGPTVFLISCGCKYSVSLPHDALGWSEVSVIGTFSEIIFFCLCISRIWIIKLNICKIYLTYLLFKMISNCLFV